jgi:UDP-N-acetylmuramoyl-tripeptide--D-alanyl-D-alanine ligase
MFNVNDILNAVNGAELYSADDSSATSEILSVTTDTRKVSPQSLFIALKGDKFDGHDFLHKAVESGAAVLCINAYFAENAKIPSNVIVITVPDTLTAYQQIARFYRRKLSSLTVIGITGSCGKTSVKEILKTLLSAIYGEDAVYATEANNNNHIGVPLSLLSVKSSHRFAVIEMGTNHPGEIETVAKIAEPDIALITTVARAHLEFLGDIDGVAEEKAAILKSYGKALTPVAVLPDQCPGIDILKERAGEEVYTFGTTDSADVKVSYLGGNAVGSRIKLSFSSRLKDDTFLEDLELNCSLTGSHQALNAGSALLAALLTFDQISSENLAKLANAIEHCTLTGMRMKFSEIDGVKWINDAYNANPDSLRGAIEWLAEFADSSTSHIVLGDMLEMGAEGPEFHKEILHLADQLLPKANIYPVGPLMGRAAKFADIQSYPDAETVSAKLAETVKVGDLIFLKGSRGIALESVFSDLKHSFRRGKPAGDGNQPFTHRSEDSETTATPPAGDGNQTCPHRSEGSETIINN